MSLKHPQPPTAENRQLPGRCGVFGGRSRRLQGFAEQAKLHTFLCLPGGQNDVVRLVYERSDWSVLAFIGAGQSAVDAASLREELRCGPGQRFSRRRARGCLLVRRLRFSGADVRRDMEALEAICGGWNH